MNMQDIHDKVAQSIAEHFMPVDVCVGNETVTQSVHPLLPRYVPTTGGPNFSHDDLSNLLTGD